MVDSSYKIRDLIGVPYLTGGRDKKGIDCYGLFIEVMKRNGIVVPDLTEIVSVCDNTVGRSEIIRNQIDEYWEKIDVPEEGCAVAIAMDYENPDVVQHLGVYLGKKTIIHVFRKMGIILSTIDDPMIKNRIRGYYKWKGSINEQVKL